MYLFHVEQSHHVIRQKGKGSTDNQKTVPPLNYILLLLYVRKKYLDVFEHKPFLSLCCSINAIVLTVRA
jgi:hypothetical protein